MVVASHHRKDKKKAAASADMDRGADLQAKMADSPSADMPEVLTPIKKDKLEYMMSTSHTAPCSDSEGEGDAEDVH